MQVEQTQTDSRYITEMCLWVCLSPRVSLGTMPVNKCFDFCKSTRGIYCEMCECVFCINVTVTFMKIGTNAGGGVG